MHEASCVWAAYMLDMVQTLVSMLTNAIDIFDDLQEASMADCICGNTCPECAMQEPSYSTIEISVTAQTWPIGLLPALRASEEGAVCAAHIIRMDRSMSESEVMWFNQAVANDLQTGRACFSVD